MTTYTSAKTEAGPITTPFNIPGIRPATDPRITSISSVAVKAITENNGDLVQTPIREFVYALLIDAVGGVRQGAAAVAAVATLAGGFIVAGAAEVFIPFGLLFTGIFSLDTAMAWSIPDALKELDGANNEFELVAMDQNHPLGLEEAKKNVEIARLGLANQSLYGLMGAGQIASGFVTIISSPFVHIFNQLFYHLFNFFHWSYKAVAPLLTGAAAKTAAVASSVALGAIYAVRGTIIMTRAAKKLIDVNVFQNDFSSHLQDKDSKTKIAKAMNFMKREEVRGKSYLSRRVDPICLEDKDKKITYTAQGIRNQNGELSNYSNAEDKIKYLERVDKGIHSEKLKNKIVMIIAGTMIIGGILAIILAVAFTGGIAPLVIGLISAIFFISMEYIYLTYDSSYLFKKLRDHLYDQPNVIGLISAIFFISMEYIYLTYDSSYLFKKLRDHLYDQPKWLNEFGLRGDEEHNSPIYDQPQLSDKLGLSNEESYSPDESQGDFGNKLGLSEDEVPKGFGPLIFPSQESEEEEEIL